MQSICTLEDHIDKSTLNRPKANIPLKIKFVHDGVDGISINIYPMDICVIKVANINNNVSGTLDNRTNLKGSFCSSSVTSKPVSIREKTKIKNEWSEYNVFINCNSLVECIDFYNHYKLEDGNIAILMLVGTRDFEQYSYQRCDSENVLYLYTLRYGNNKLELNSMNSNVITEKIKVDMIFSYLSKDDPLVNVKWIDFPELYDTENKNFVLFVVLYRSGIIKICLINDNELNYRINLISVNNISPEDRVKKLSVIWEYDHSKQYNSDFIICFDISYSSNPLTAFKLVCGTNNGFLLIWDFDLSMLYSNLTFENTPLLDEIGCIKNGCRLIPVIHGISSNKIGRTILCIKFMPILDSCILAIGTFSNSIILWDISSSYLEGEIRTYNNITKPVNAIGWSLDLKHLLGCGNNGYYIDWQHNSSVVSITSDKFVKQKTEMLFDNICWNVDSNIDDVNFIFDDGAIVILPISNLKKRSLDENFIMYKWISYLDDNQILVEPSSKKISIYEKLQNMMFENFMSDMKTVKNVGVTIIKNTKESKAIAADVKFTRSKVLSHHAIKSTCIATCGVKLKLLAYGGNLGIIHIVAKTYY